MLDTTRHHKHLARSDLNFAVAKLDLQHTLPADEHLIVAFVVMPRERSGIDLDDPQLLPGELGQHAGPPRLVDQCQLFGNVQRALHQPTLPSSEIEISFCVSTMNSIGKCCSTSRTKPLTISATASSSLRPRWAQ